MKTLRALTRRGFNVGTAGYFSVLRPNTWFAASRLPDHPYDLGRFKEIAKPTPGQNTQSRASSPESTMQWQMIDLSRRDRHLFRSSIIVVGAIAITLALLLWIMHPNFK